MAAGRSMERGCDMWIIHGHARCRVGTSCHSRSGCIEPKKTEVDMGCIARDEPDVYQELRSKCRKPINFLISMAQRTAHERPRRMAVWCLREQRARDRGKHSKNKKQERRHLAAQEQFVQAARREWLAVVGR